MYLLVAAIVTVITLLAINMARGSTGRNWMAVRDMDIAAESMGVSLLKTKLQAFAINAEVKAGRGSPHGGVFLDVSKRIPADVIKKRLPSMWHQFYELAGVDITKEPMEVGPTCHYVMGGVEVEPDTAAAGNTNPRVLAFGAVLIGIALAAAIQVLTGFFTEVGKRPVNDVAASSQTGAATVILAGIAVGFESAVYSAILIAAAVFGAFALGGGSIVLSLLAIAIAGTGLLTTVGVIVAMDTFGPISDNAQGIAEMSGDVKGEGAQILTSLDAVGNTTKAITKGIAIATAVLAATALFGAFTSVQKV